MKVTIKSIGYTADDIRVFTLEPVSGELPPYEAGSHVELTLGNGLKRQYSLCCSSYDPRSYRIAVKQESESRGGSQWLHSQAHPGVTLDISAPRNAFALSDRASSHLLFAGGIGVTPILSMAYELVRRGSSFQVHYFARNAKAAAFLDEFNAPALHGRVIVHLGASVEETASLIMKVVADAPNGTEVYSCGPQPFIQSVRHHAVPRFGDDKVHQELFKVVVDESANQPFVIRLADGREVPVSADKTALECLVEAGLDIESSCEVGVCGTCFTEVADGIPDHRDDFLSAEEKQSNRCFMPCVSRSKSPVIVIKRA